MADGHLGIVDEVEEWGKEPKIDTEEMVNAIKKLKRGESSRTRPNDWRNAENLDVYGLK